jgi:nicotinate-nucleotide adenylyltransferase
MTEALIADEPGLEVSDYEITREDTSYTVETLEHFRSLYPNADLFLIVGTDQALKMSEWREPKRLAELATIVVANRDALHETEARKAVTAATGKEPLFVETSFMSVSSTIVRKRFAEGGEISRMTGEGVAALYADALAS